MFTFCCRSGTDDEEFDDYTQLLSEVAQLMEEGVRIKATKKEEAKALIATKNKDGLDLRLAAMKTLKKGNHQNFHLQ